MSGLGHSLQGSRPSVLLGVERISGYTQFVQWTMAAQSGHPVFLRAVELINASFFTGSRSEHLNAVKETGPIVFTQAVLQYLDSQPTGKSRHYLTQLQEGSNVQLDDVAILNVNAFGSFQDHSNSTHDSSQPDICVVHNSYGRWKSLSQNHHYVVLGQNIIVVIRQWVSREVIQNLLWLAWLSFALCVFINISDFPLRETDNAV